jgi:hypothetical protein
MKTTILCGFCLLIGFLIGLLVPKNADKEQPDVAKLSSELPMDPSGSAQTTEATPVQLIGGDADTNLPPEIQRPVVSYSNSATVVVTTDLIARLSQSGSSRNLGQALIDPDGAIEQALQISEQEQAQIQTSWESTKQGLKEQEVRASLIQEMEDMSVRITIPEMASQLDVISKQFNQSVQRTLGQNRGDVFLAAKQVDQALAKSSAERTYTIVAESPKEGEWRFNMTLESPAGRRVWVGESIPDEIRHLTDAAKIFPTISDLPE